MPAPEPPIRAELFSVERLEQHAGTLATAQEISVRPGGERRLDRRLYDNTRVLTAAYSGVLEAAGARQPITPAAEWLLDNFHIVNEQIRQIKDDLPPGYYRMLPKLAGGPLQGYPRVFGIAWALIAHTDSAFDEPRLTRFVRAYQRVQPLTIGELWALPITLRITLVENLRRLSEAIMAQLRAQQTANAIADDMPAGGAASAGASAALLRRLEAAPWTTSFAVGLAQRLRNHDPDATPELRWLNGRLAGAGTATDQAVQEEFQSQSAIDVTVRNVITSMRLVSAINWAELFESISPVDAILRADAGFSAMDFQTRDLYRRMIEELSRRSARKETEVAQRALAAARSAARRAGGSAAASAAGQECDPGYYLIGQGRRAFEIELGCRVPLKTRLFRLNSGLGVISYIGMIALASLCALSLGLLAVWGAGIGGSALFMLALVGLVPASDVAVALVNRGITSQLRGTLLPGLELRDGIAREQRTIVVVPVMLTDVAQIEQQIDGLEVHHLASQDDNFLFALLSDWGDAAAEHAAEDTALLAAAAAGIARLNARYGVAGDSARFLLLHRRRVWNAGEGKWIGWERKRGKLHELNRLLRGAADTSFMPIDGHLPAPPAGIRYVITLDADTRLPIGAAKRLVGKMAHPLNLPRLDRAAGVIVAGHAILQPRVTPSLPVGSGGSLFQRVFSGPNGLDPYALAVSDVYQDLFDEGSYCGKGIYDVDAFEAAIGGQIAESEVLSHDLLEGIFGRAGLVSDVEVVEEFPSRYAVSAARQHRWVRGDWQLLPWIFSTGAGKRRGPIPLMGRWKLFDNLRRSLSAPTALLALLVGWTLPATPAAVWTAFIVLTIVLPPLLPGIAGIVPWRGNVTLGNHLRFLRRTFALGLLQSGFLVTFLAHQSLLMADAIGRTLFRLFVRRRHLLEWTTTAQSADVDSFDPRGLAWQMAGSLACAVTIGALLFWLGEPAWPIAVPFAALWLLSPLVARWTSMPPPLSGHMTVSPADAVALRLVARRTWRFFETFVTAADNMLPPDNFQENPQPLTAHRTSPTNLGLYLLSVVAARDFGWLGTHEALERLEATLASMSRLERLRGHFYNWYDTTDMRVLDPPYLSSVDSGNLAGHLVAVANACREMASGPPGCVNWVAGLEDALALVRAADATGETTSAGQAVDMRASLEAACAAIDTALARVALATDGVGTSLAALAPMADRLVACALACTGADTAEVVIWAEALRASVASHRRDFDDSEEATVAPIVQRLTALAEQAMALFHEMDFGFLFDADRQLLSIGYRGRDASLDANFYDLLASEARLASFVAIAKGDLPAKHWFRLGRTLTPIEGGAALISWSGSMFEYLMPSLVMRAPTGSLLEQTNRLAVAEQRDYATRRGVPWGISESEYNARDAEQNYQYSGFGVPTLGFKRGLGDDLVIAPYATGLACMVDPTSAAKNFARLAEIGARGDYGWYEALDYTPSRRPEGIEFVLIRAYMAHHQAMTVVGIANALHDGRMRARFHEEPIMRAAELLLQERMPRDVAIARVALEQVNTPTQDAGRPADTQRHYASAHSRAPRTHLLGNGRYSVMLTAVGSGYSRWHDVAITRWREDATRDRRGAYIFLRDVGQRKIWSAGYQPTNVEPDSYDVTFSEDRAEIVRRDGDMTTTLEVMVSPEDDAEVRRVSITNNGSQSLDIEVTSYAELVLARQADDVAHPAFGALFVNTEFAADLGAILATRRQRSDADPVVWVAHLAVVEGEGGGDVQFETDRARFVGRGQAVRSPAGIADGWPLSNTAGAVLDPILSLRRHVRIARGATARIAFWTVVAASREEVLDLADKHRDPMAFERAKTLAWTQAQMQMRHLGIASRESHLFQRLANVILYSHPALRPPAELIRRGAGKASVLWGQGISGDLPIVLVRIDDESHIDLIRQLLRAHEYWGSKLLAVDLVVLNARTASYAQDLQGALEALVRIHRSTSRTDGRDTGGSVIVVRSDLAPPAVVGVLQFCARAVLHGDRGSLAEQLRRVSNRVEPAPPPPRAAPVPALQAAFQAPPMEFFNGIGGFANNGRDYLTILDGSARTPAPWLNVIANPGFGFQVSTDGSGFTWSVNSQQNQLTSWSNDPVADPPGEAFYVRDEDTGELWGPTSLPIRETHAPYTARHGQGFSVFRHDSHGIALELVQYVPIDDPIKVSRLKIANLSGRPRHLSVTAYVEWVLGANRAAGAPFIVTELDAASGALFARNAWNDQFGERVAFVDLAGVQTSWTGDRGEFLGRHGEMDRPQGLAPGRWLSGRVGAALDPCAALQSEVRLDAGSTVEVVCFLGQAPDAATAAALVVKYRAADLDEVLAAVNRQWDDCLGAVQVRTPDRALDILLNRWLPYQTLACRVWARTGFYQASGAYGFRDQLQDIMALCLSRPDIARAHLLRAAARQFVEGDVQHWWLAESGKGVRTRVSDDRGWLAYVVAHYVDVTGDAAVLDEMVPFLEGKPLAPDEHDAFFAPTVSATSASLFEHCALALEDSLQTGAHGLPLMGTGDWNDGMNAVGADGKGESVWLGWFLHAALSQFAGIARVRGDAPRAAAWLEHARALKVALDEEAWDGDWYRRAFFDDGSPLGSVSNTECRIDSIAQSWAVISGAGDPERRVRAMAALDKYLIRRDSRLSLLFTPPFDTPAHDPGYIKGYPPGIRENGGQYTHAAVWAMLAFTIQGDGDRAGELLAMLNPIHHADTPTAVQRYKVEPYVACADVYSEPPHIGRGGWTWYTGSAGWLYRAALEGVLGVRLHGATLELDPCLPRDWPGFEVVLRYRSARYEIVVRNPNGVCQGIRSATLDGQAVLADGWGRLPLVDDGATHNIQVILGSEGN
jgi:cyclic beta-1,2-glucan synthetase